MKKTIIAIFFIAMNYIFLGAQTKCEKIDSVLNNYYDKGQFNGNVLVSENGIAIYKESFG